MLRRFSDITDIIFGPYLQSKKEGYVKYVTSSHFDKFLRLTKFSDSYVTLQPKDEKHLLQEGDILLTGKGRRLFAWSYDPSFGACVPSSLFYRIRPNSDILIPGYLSLYLNTDKVKYQLELIGAGTSMLSIPKKELGNLMIPVPSIEEQSRLVSLVEIMDKNISVSQDILNEKKTLRKGVIADLITQINDD